MGNLEKNIALHTLWQDYLQGTLVNTINEIAGAVLEFSALVFGIVKWLFSTMGPLIVRILGLGKIRIK